MSYLTLQPRLCRGHAFCNFFRVDLQISPVKLPSRLALHCVLQCFVQVEANFFIYVLSNSATAFMGHLRFTVRLRFAVRQFCELDTSTYASTAFWLSCSFVTCDSHVVGEGRCSITDVFLTSMCLNRRTVVSEQCPMCTNLRTVVYFGLPWGGPGQPLGSGP